MYANTLWLNINGTLYIYFSQVKSHVFTSCQIFRFFEKVWNYCEIWRKSEENSNLIQNMHNKFEHFTIFLYYKMEKLV